MNFYSDIEELITELSMNYSFDLNIILEGNDDKKLFESTICGANRINFICAGGSEYVTTLIEKLDSITDRRRLVPTLGVIDRDYCIPLGKILYSPNLLMTDFRDLECMMINSPSFDIVLKEFGSLEKIKKNGGSSKIEAKAVNAASAIAELRYHSQIQKINISFKKLDIERLLDKKSLEIDSDTLIPHLNSRQSVAGLKISNAAIADARKDCKRALCQSGNAYFSNPFLLCRGHDLMEILAIGFRSLFGTRTPSESTRENIERLFRLNYASHFKSSELAKSINIWLQSHTFYPGVMVV